MFFFSSFFFLFVVVVAVVFVIVVVVVIIIILTRLAKYTRGIVSRHETRRLLFSQICEEEEALTQTHAVSIGLFLAQGPHQPERNNKGIQKEEGIEEREGGIE